MDVVLRTFPDGYTNNAGGPKTFYQGGTHFRTLCEKCNSGLLGTEYDPELAKLCNEIRKLAEVVSRKEIALPSDVLVFVKPQRIARAIVGHILAANAVEEAKNGLISAPLPDALRRYFLNDASVLPTEADIYVWVYPSRRQVIVKGAGKISLKYSNVILGHILKFLPLGFWLVWEKPLNLSINLPTLVPDKRMRIDDICQMRVELTNIPPLDFPEAPTSGELISMHEGSTSVSIPRKKS